MTPEEFTQLCVDLEHFETPKWAADAILRKEILTPHILDPCAGIGILGDAAERSGYNQPIAIDIHEWGYPLDFKQDFLTMQSGGMSENFTILMNPPFSRAHEFVIHSMRLGASKIVCFQRFAWWESDKRRNFWANYSPNRVFICGDRASSWRHDIPIDQRGSGTPTAHAWYVWDVGSPPGTLLGHVYRDDRPAKLPI